MNIEHVYECIKKIFDEVDNATDGYIIAKSIMDTTKFQLDRKNKELKKQLMEE